MIPRFSLLLLLALQLYAFEDDDIDGVENSKDLCPDTSFEETVDETGCPENHAYWGLITLSLGSDTNIDESSTTDYSFFSNYRYDRWEFSLSSSQQSTLDSNNNPSQDTGDLYLSSSYNIYADSFHSRITLGSKIAIGGEDVSTGENDYFLILTLTYPLHEALSLLAQINYTKTGDNNITEYHNPFGYNLGIGYLIGDNFYTEISYQYTQSIYPQEEAYQSLSLFNSYNFSHYFFGTLGYTRGLDVLSYDHSISLRLGVTYE